MADSHKAEVMTAASQFAALGWTIDATEGTAAYLKRWGIDVTPVPLDDLVDRLRSGEWNMVLNIPGGNERHITSGAALRKSATSAGIPCLHSIPAAWAVASSLAKNHKKQ